MAVSQNGWIADDRSVCASQPVPGSDVRLTVRADAPGQLLVEVASAFNRLVEPISNGRGALDDWGYAERPIRGGWQLSNHASGTAIDLDSALHPLGVDPHASFSQAQIDAIHRILAVTGGVVRWGGDYGDPRFGGIAGSRPDAMHFEVNDGQDEASCQRALDRMRVFNNPNWIEESDMAVPVLREGDGFKGGGDRGRLHWWVLRVQALLQPNISGVPAGACPVDGMFGPSTTAAVRAFQASPGRQLPVTGVVDLDTWRLLLGNDAPDFA